MRRFVFVATALVACETVGSAPHAEVVAASSSRSSESSGAAFEQNRAQIGARARAMVEAGEVGALSVALVAGGRIAWSEGFGSASDGVRADSSTVYRVGSLAKPLLAVAVLQQVERGRWSLDQPLADHLPALRSDATAVGREPTLRDVLTHRSGLPSEDLGLAWTGPSAEWRALPAQIGAIPSTRAPGRVLSYSNVAFTLLGAALENVTNTPFAEHMHRSVLEPAGMSTAGYGPLTGDHARPRGAELDAGLVPAAGLYASVDDMARFVAMVSGGGELEGRRLLAAVSVTEMLRIQNEDSALDFRTRVGLGWQRDPAALAALGEVAWHDGQVPGHHAVMLVLPRHGLGAVVLATTEGSGAAVESLAFAMLETAAAEQGVANSPTSARPRLPALPPMTDPTGVFMMQDEPMTVSRGKGALTVDPPRALAPGRPGAGGGSALAHVSAQTYRRADDQMLVHFARVDGIDIIVGELDGVRGRLGERVPTRTVPAVWRDRAGIWLPPAEGWFGFERAELRIAEGHLVLAHDSSWAGAPPRALALVPLDHRSAVLAGLGRGKGETVWFTESDGEGAPVMHWQGLGLKRAGD